MSGRLSTGIRSDAGGGSGDDNDDDEEEDTSQALSLQILLPTRESASGSSGDPSPSTEARMRTKKKQRDVVRAEEACPACGIAFGPGRRRKLIEATCGHARCYECTFRSEDCQVCERLGGGGGLPPFKGPVYEEIDQGGRGGRQPCPRPPRPHSVAGNHESSPFSLRGGRESGFQSYSSVTSSVASLNFREDDDVQDLDDRLSQCSSTLSVGGASSVASAFSNLPPIRRDLKRRSLGMMRSDVARRFEARGACGSTGGSGAGAAGLLSRNAFARRSSHFPSTRAFGGMAAIREQNYSESAETFLCCRRVWGVLMLLRLGTSFLSSSPDTKRRELSLQEKKLSQVIMRLELFLRLLFPPCCATSSGMREKENFPKYERTFFFSLKKRFGNVIADGEKRNLSVLAPCVCL